MDSKRIVIGMKCKVSDTCSCPNSRSGQNPPQCARGKEVKIVDIAFDVGDGEGHTAPVVFLGELNGLPTCSFVPMELTPVSGAGLEIGMGNGNVISRR